jgi:hypothetical protein
VSSASASARSGAEASELCCGITGAGVRRALLQHRIISGTRDGELRRGLARALVWELVSSAAAPRGVEEEFSGRGDGGASDAGREVREKEI